MLVTGEDTCQQLISWNLEPSSGRGGGFHRPCSYRLVYRSEAPSARLRTAQMFSRVDESNCAVTSHMHDDPDGRHDLYMWSTQPAKTCVRRIEGISQSGQRRSGLARRASARWSISRCLCRLTYAGINVHIFGGSTPPRVHVETSQPAKTPARNEIYHRADAVARVIGGEEFTPTLSRHFRSRSSPALPSSLSTASSSASSLACRQCRPRRRTPWRG